MIFKFKLNACLIILVSIIFFSGAIMADGFLIMQEFYEAADYDYEIVDFGGETVTLHAHKPFFESEAAQERIEKAGILFNVNIEYNFVDYMDGPENVVTRIMAGDSEYDMYNLPGWQFIGLVTEGYLFPICDVVTEEYWTRGGDRMIETVTGADDIGTFLGKRYKLGVSGIPGPGGFFVWNKDLFEDEGLPNLYDLWKAGDWDWDKLAEIAIDAAKIGPDGEIERYGMMGRLGIFYELIAANKATEIKYRDGRWVYDPGEEFIYTMNYIQNLIIENAYPDSYRKNTDVDGAFLEGKTAMATLPLWVIWGEDFEETDMNWSLMVYPPGPHAGEGKYVPGRHSEMRVLPMTSAKPAGMVSLHDFLFGSNAARRFENIEEGLQNTLARFPDRESADVYKTLFMEYTRYIDDLPEIVGNQTRAARAANYDLRDPRTVIEELTPEAQAKIDDALN